MLSFLLIPITIFICNMYFLRSRISCILEVLALAVLFIFNIIIVYIIFDKYHWFGLKIGHFVLLLMINAIVNSFLPLLLLLKKKKSK